jgi:hypothetical protein
MFPALDLAQLPAMLLKDRINLPLCNLAGVEMAALPPSTLAEMIERYPYIIENFPGLQALEADPIPLIWAKLR